MSSKTRIEKSKAVKFQSDLIQTVKKLKRKVIPDYLFWDMVAKIMDAPAAKCIIVYSKLDQEDINRYDPIHCQDQQSSKQNLQQHILASDDFDVQHIKPQVPNTINVTVENAIGQIELLIVQNKTLLKIPYFKQILEKTTDFQLSIQSDIEVFRQIILFLERNNDSQMLNLTPKNVVQIIAASQFLEIPKISNICLQYIAENHILLTYIDFKFITNQDILKLLFSKSIFNFILEDTNFIKSQLLTKLMGYCIQIILNNNLNAFLQCSKCQRFTTQSINSQYGSQLYCDASPADEKLLHCFEFVINPLDKLKKYIQNNIGHKMYTFDLFIGILFTCSLVRCNDQLLFLDQCIEENFIVEFCEIDLEKFQFISDFPLILQNQQIFRQIMKQVKEVIKIKTSILSFALINETQDFIQNEKTELTIKGKQKFQTKRFQNFQRHNSKRESFEAYEQDTQVIQTADMDQYMDIYPEHVDKEESIEENFVDLVKSQVYVDQFQYCKNKFSKYLELKPHLNDRQKKSLLSEAAHAESQLRMGKSRIQFLKNYQTQPFSAKLFVQSQAVNQVFFQATPEQTLQKVLKNYKK
ncbi:hypothetical protein SS50377_23103 [Spironucleus salmonicida]|uniref:Uncharacterized protein n=1 Tax=Spironucleus salmonicida TaxID=348837 RepID=V6LBE2_9EUKA|nr:hypothetical protein SS50377_23103 [Spironucleus salmonicida]|eukprot:EST41722.1 Hypothetical protein SS50377_18808 [Spironucleus salmonicida]